MTSPTPTRRAAARAPRRSARITLVGALALGILVGGATAGATTPPHEHDGPGDIALPDDAPDCDPKLGSCDITLPDDAPDPDPEVPPGPDDIALPDDAPECDPKLGSCDITLPDDAPDPDPEVPDDGEDLGGDGPEAEVPDGDVDGTGREAASAVDAPIVATPAFTG